MFIQLSPVMVFLVKLNDLTHGFRPSYEAWDVEGKTRQNRQPRSSDRVLGLLPPLALPQVYRNPPDLGMALSLRPIEESLKGRRVVQAL